MVPLVSPNLSENSRQIFYHQTSIMCLKTYAEETGVIVFKKLG